MVNGEPGADVRMLATEVVCEDPWLRLRRDEIERRGGSRGTYAFVEKPDYAVVVPAVSAAGQRGGGGRATAGQGRAWIPDPLITCASART
jgi:hypothetical protein